MSYKLYNKLFAQVWKRLPAFKVYLEIDQYIKIIFERHGFKSAPYTKKFPGFSCISVNNIICHGIPSKQMIKSGDVVNIDISVYNKNVFYDSARCFVAFDRSEISNIRKNKVVAKMILLYRHHFLFTTYCPRLSYHEELTNETVKFCKGINAKVFDEFMGHHIGKSLWVKPNIKYHHIPKGLKTKFGTDVCFTHEPIISESINYLYRVNEWMTCNKTYCFAIENMYYIKNDRSVVRLTTYYTTPFVVFDFQNKLKN